MKRRVSTKDNLRVIDVVRGSAQRGHASQRAFASAPMLELLPSAPFARLHSDVIVPTACETCGVLVQAALARLPLCPEGIGQQYACRQPPRDSGLCLLEPVHRSALWRASTSGR